ncbi:MAG: DUF6503 family protein [Bacteroidota bacterium]
MRNFLFFFCLLFFGACQNEQAPATTTDQSLTDANPPANGFLAEASDEKAMAIADSVMLAMGGRKNWDRTRYIGWTFFNRRHLLWDKKTGRVRISMKDDSTTIYQINIKDDTGKVLQEGVALSEPDSVAKYLDRAKSIWINDAYWLVMPFKLKDSGVALKYVGQDTMMGGKDAEVLELTFREVGKTPENKYLVYIDPATNLVSQWDFFSTAADKEARFSTPWADYEQHGNILLSGNRGRGSLTDIAVYDEIPDSVFQSLAPIDISSL